MKKMLIIEDESQIGLYLKKLLQKMDENFDIHGPLISVTEVINELALHNDYDLIFADIRLTDGLIFEAFQCIKPNSFVVFTTAYNEYAMQAIKNNGLDYLMKPIDPLELQKAIDKLELAKSVNEQQIQTISKELFADVHIYRERFLVNKGDCYKMIFANDIDYIYKDESHVYAYTNSGMSYSLPQTLNDLELELNPKRFFRINRQYIANINAIVQLNNYFGSKLVVKLRGCDDDNIVASREKSALLKKWLDQ